MSNDFVRKTDGRHALALYLYRKEPKSVGRNSNVHAFSRARHVCQNGDARDFLDVDLECLRSHLFCSINANFEWLPPDGLFFFSFFLLRGGPCLFSRICSLSPNNLMIKMLI